MSPEDLVNKVRSTTTRTTGRSLNSCQGNHFVIDEPEHAGGPHEAITPADAFLSGVSACGVLLVENFAHQKGIPLEQAEATIEGHRDPGDTSVFQHVDIHFVITGPDRQQAEELVTDFKNK